MKLAAALLLLGVLRHYGWGLVPSDHQAQVWNLSGAVVITILLWPLAARHRLAMLVAMWWTFEEAQVAICSTAYMVRPWEIPDGEAQCSSLLGFDLSALGLALISGVLVAIVKASNTKDGGGQA